jgi:hypothetical protein
MILTSSSLQYYTSSFTFYLSTEGYIREEATAAYDSIINHICFIFRVVYITVNYSHWFEFHVYIAFGWSVHIQLKVSGQWKKQLRHIMIFQS